MNAVFAAVLLAVVATCSGTVVSGYTGYGSQYYVPSTYGSAVQYVQPSNYGYVQPVVSSSNVVSQSALPINYASSAAYVPSTYTNGLYGLQYPYTYNYGTYGYGLLKK